MRNTLAVMLILLLLLFAWLTTLPSELDMPPAERPVFRVYLTPAADGTIFYSGPKGAGPPTTEPPRPRGASVCPPGYSLGEIVPGYYTLKGGRSVAARCTVNGWQAVLD